MKMVANDRLEREKADSRNAVEAYVYEMRDKLSSHLEPFMKESEREKYSRLLNETEDWLYGDGEDVSRDLYVKRLEELKVSYIY